MKAYKDLLPDAPERIFRIAEARTVDASQRMDRLVDAEIEQSKSDRATASVFLLFFFVASVVFFALGNNFAGGAFISVPVIGLLRTMWTSRIAKSGPFRSIDPPEPDEHQGDG